MLYRKSALQLRKTRKGGIPVDWNAIKAEYIAGGTSYRKLAEKYGLSESTLRKKAAKEQWSKLRNKAGTKTEQRIIDSVSKESAKNATSTAKLIDDSARLAAEKIYRALAKETTAYDLQSYVRSLKTLKEIVGVKSDLDIKEQKARIANLEKQAQSEGTNDTTYNIVCGADGEDYSI